MIKRNPTVDTLKDGTNFLNTANPNNQAMMASTNNLASTKELGRSDSKYLTKVFFLILIGISRAQRALVQFREVLVDLSVLEISQRRKLL